MRVADRTAGASRRILILILLAFLALALVYSVSLPLGEAPDEVPHFNFVRFLAKTHALPEGQEAGSEGVQPPLYYAIGALATSWIDVGDAQLRANSDFSWDRPETSRNLLLHTKAEAFPYQGWALAWHIVRFLSILMGAVTVVATFLIGQEIFPQRPAIALGMAAITAFTPEFIFMSSVVNNDNLVAMLSALLMLKLIRILKGATAWRDFIQLGSLLGLSLIAKASAIVFIPLALMVLFSTPAGKRLNLLQSSLWSTITVIFAFGFSGWWFLRNHLVFGDPLAWSLKVSMTDLRQTPLGLNDFIWLVDGLFQSFWGRFGGAAHLRLGFPVYVALSLLVLASLAGCALAIVRLVKSRRPFDNPSWAFLGLAALNIALVFVALIRWTMAFLGTDQARLVYPALPALVLFFLLGLLQIVPTRWHRFAVAGLGFGLFTLAVITPWAYIAPVYRAPALLSSADLPSTSHLTSYDFDGVARLVGYRFDGDLYQPGETAQLVLYWQALGQARDDQWLQIQLVDRSGHVVFQKEGCPSGGSYSADLWRTGDVVPGNHFLRLSPSLPADTYALRLAMRPSSSKAWLPVFNRLTGGVSDNVTVGKVRVGSVGKPSPVAMEQPVQATLGGKFALVGYTLKGSPRPKPGDHLTLYLYWQKLPGVTVNVNLTVFTQILDASNAIRAQVDSQPQRGGYPTTVWDDKETIVDEYELALSQQTQPGDHRLVVGLYDSATGQRLSVVDGKDGNPLGDFVGLTTLKIEQ